MKGGAGDIAERLRPEVRVRLREIAETCARLQQEASHVMADEAARLSGNPAGDAAMRAEIAAHYESLVLEAFRAVCEAEGVAAPQMPAPSRSRWGRLGDFFRAWFGRKPEVRA